MVEPASPSGTVKANVPEPVPSSVTPAVARVVPPAMARQRMSNPAGPDVTVQVIGAPGGAGLGAQSSVGPAEGAAGAAGTDHCA